jgi:hypothetical protein
MRGEIVTEIKHFGTHLPVLTPAELMIVMGQAVRALTEMGWSVGEIVRVPGQAQEAWQSSGTWQALRLSFVAYAFGADGWALHVDFEAPDSAPAESQVGAAMQAVHGALLRLLEPPPGVSLWTLTHGAWKHGVRFSG